LSDDRIEQFLQLLKASPAGPVFNPWWQVDKEDDIGRQAPAIRRKQLAAYLQDRAKTARLMIIGEALGYRGGHFTGIPMTSERILLGRNENVPNESANFFASIEARRTSEPNKYRDGFSEPTATIVWDSLLHLGLSPEQFVLWNAFPWHSFHPRHGILSNRTPNQSERAAGLPVLKVFLKLFSGNRVVALGKIAAAQLQKLDISACCIRHPASGGARLFRGQIAEVLGEFVVD
jgi:uracil-DNA glycosylase